MARYDLDRLKHLAAGRWPELLGLDSQLLDTRHHPCPKCGGTDRFRALSDFAKSGALVCNQCFTKGNGDGIASYAWLQGCTTAQAIEQLAERVGLDPISQAAKSNGNKPTGQYRPKKSAQDQFSLKPLPESIAAIFAARKGGIQAHSLVALGAQVGNHFGANVIALPIRSATGATVGFTAANSTGGKITISYPDGESEATSWKNVINAKQKGIIGTAGLFSPQTRPNITRVYKTEGPSDLLALISFLHSGEEAFCNPCGAGENPINFPWLLEWLTDKPVVVIHDRDKAGLDGAIGDPVRARLGWATWAAQAASEVKNVELPYPLVDAHGADFRQWVMEGGERSGLEELIDQAEVIQEAITSVIEDGADPNYLARVNLRDYQERHGRRLVFYKSEWYRWKSGCYLKLEDSELRSKVHAAIRLEFERQWKEDHSRYLEKAQGSNFDPEKDQPPKIKKVTPQLVTSVVSAMSSIVQLPGTVPMPCWLPDRSKRHYVSMMNGVLDFEKVFAGAEMSDFLLPHTPNWFSQFQLKYKFDWESRCPTWLEYLDFSMEGDQERIAILQEWAGYLLTTTNYLQKFLVLEGKGGNGKTVYFAAMRAMLGDENVCSVALERFGGRFDLAQTIGRAANICGDVGEIDSVCEGTLKQFTGGDAMTFDRKNRPPLEAIPTAKLMMAWNVRPRFKDRSSGVWRRMLLLPFEREVPERRKIMGMDSHEWWLNSGEVPAILRWAIEGLDRLQTLGKFTQSKTCDSAAKEYRQESNPANDFLVEHVHEVDGHRISCQWLYQLYVAWCRENGHSYPLARNQFGKEVKRAFPKSDRAKSKRSNLETEASDTDRDRTWCYINVDFSIDHIAGNYVYGIE